MNDLRSYRDIVEVGSTLSADQTLEEFILSQSPDSLINLIGILTEDQIQKIDDYLDEEIIIEAGKFAAGISKAKKVAKKVWSRAKAGAKAGMDISTDISHGISKMSGEYTGGKRVRKFGGQFLKWTRAKGIQQANAQDYAEFLQTELDFNNNEINKAFKLSGVQPNSVQAIGRQKLELLAKSTGSILDAPSRMTGDDVSGDGDAEPSDTIEPTKAQAQTKAQPTATSGKGKPGVDAGSSGSMVSDTDMITALKNSKVNVAKVRSMKDLIHKQKLTWPQITKDKKVLELVGQIGFIYLYLS